MALGRLSLGRGLVLAAIGACIAVVSAAAQAPPPDARIATPDTPPAAELTPEVTPVAPVPSPTAEGPPGQAAGAVRPIQPPADPAAAQAFTVLEKHCARCHQGGRLRRPAPASDFGNILRLDEVAALPHLVQPGNPDASRLYLMMLRRIMPFDVHLEGSSAPAPTPEEIAAVRIWISGLAPRVECRDRRPVTPADHAQALAQLVASKSENPARLRFVSIAHLHNGCVGFEALSAYRQAVVRLFNSLSWKPAPVAVPPIDVARTLFKIDLDDLGWLPEHWERIMQSGSDPLGLAPPLAADVRKPFGTQAPVARADWFAETVLNAPLYYDVLGLPGTGPEILKILQIDAARLVEAGRALRAGIKPSRFSLQPSLIERLPARTGGFWQAYHQFSRESPVDLSQQAARQPTELVPHHATRQIFTLPNGLPAFLVVGQRGDRLDALPPDIALPSVIAQGEIRGGLDCLSCHAHGPIAQEPGSLPQPVATALQDDQKAARDALARIGVDPALTLDGVDPLVALANEHARPLDGIRAAAELGVGLDELAKIADRSGGLAAVLARRLVQGLVSRMEVEAHARDLIAALDRPLPEAASEVAKPASAEADYRPIDPGPGLILYSDKVSYKKGDPLNLVVRVGADCHLTLVSVDQRGRGTVLFPSDFEGNTLLTAGQELRLPGPGAPYSFRLSESGRETVVALCNEAGSATDGIRHDFERQRFTDLGNWAAFLARSSADAPKGEPAAPAPKRTDARQRSRRHGKVETPEERSRPEKISRTAISIVVQ